MTQATNTLNRSTADQLTALLDELDPLKKAWHKIMFTPTGRLRAKVSPANRDRAEMLRDQCRVIENKIITITKNA